MFAGTRQVYGKPDHLPVDETHLVRPTDINGINKVAGEYYHLVYNNVFGVRACSLRLTNIYGPRQLVRHNRQGFIGWFVRLVVEDKEIQIFGDGLQLRDFVYVDDAADAFLRAGATDAVNGQVFNVGGAQPISHLDLVSLLIETAGTGAYRLVEWPPEKKAIDIGSFYADSTRFRETTGWEPATTLRDGLARTIAYYRRAPAPLPGVIGCCPCLRPFAFRSCRCGPATIARRSTPPSRASSIAAGSSSAPSCRRSNRSWRPPPAPRTRSASAPAPTRCR